MSEEATKETELDKETKVIDTLREKIKSKMDVAKFFTGFITLLTGLLLKDGDLLSPFYFRIGVVFLIASLGLCVAAMSTYDHLLWPKEHFDFTGDEKQAIVFRKKLETEMVRSWKWLFAPAIVCFGLGLFFVLLPKLSLINQFDCKNGVWIFVLVIAFVTPILLCVFKWPRLEKNNEGSANHK